jgi:uncharacterized membrane protein YbaN (DUF454 family)
LALSCRSGYDLKQNDDFFSRQNQDNQSFLLLALACFARSSERFYDWLLDHAHFGPIVQPYINGCGISRASKVKAIALLWASIILSAFFLIELVWVRSLLLVIACAVTLYLLYLPTHCNKNNSTDT